MVLTRKASDERRPPMLRVPSLILGVGQARLLEVGMGVGRGRLWPGRLPPGPPLLDGDAREKGRWPCGLPLCLPVLFNGF